MARKRKKARPFFLDPTNKCRHFSRVFDVMTDSAAYNSLSLAARALLHYMIQKYNGADDTFTCTYTELVARGYSRSCVRSYIRELMRAGFIEIQESKNETAPAVYRYSARWFDDS